MDTQNASGLAQFLADCGPYGLSAILCLCVAHLYKRQGEQNKETREIHEKYAENVRKYGEDVAKLQEQTLSAIRTNNEALNALREELREMRRKD